VILPLLPRTSRDPCRPRRLPRRGRLPFRWGLGFTLYHQGHVDEAIANWRKSIELDPNDASAYRLLSGALADQGHLDEAVASQLKAIELEPESAAAHQQLGTLLEAQEHVDEAIASYRRAIELDPRDEGSYNRLGIALLDQGHRDQAIASYCKALELDPEFGPTHVNLGQLERRQGRLEEALAHFCLAYKYFSPKRDEFSVRWAKHSESNVADIERQIAQKPALLAIVRGERAAASPQEWSDAAALAMNRQEHLAALHVCERALAADPKLLEAYAIGSTAVGCAALAGCGRAGDAATLTDIERAALRGKAFVWLRALVNAWRELLAGTELQRAEALQCLETSYTDMAGLRDEAALNLLPAEEAENWRVLSREITELLEKGQL